jgi:hypothetical protein
MIWRRPQDSVAKIVTWLIVATAGGALAGALIALLIWDARHN